MPPSLTGTFERETALFEAFLDKIYRGRKPRPRREEARKTEESCRAAEPRRSLGACTLQGVTPERSAERRTAAIPAAATSSKAKFVAIVGPYIPMREHPEVASRMLGVVRHGEHVQFEDLPEGRPVAVEDLVRGRYLRCWRLRADGSRGLSGWVIVHTERGLHFMPCADGEQPVTSEITARFQAEAQALLTKTGSSWEQHLNSCPRRDCSALPAPPLSTKHLLLGVGGCGVQQRRRRRTVLVAFLAWGPVSCPVPIARWLHKHFEVKTLRVPREVVSQLLEGKSSIGEDTLVLIVVHEPRAWALSAIAAGDRGFFQLLERSSNGSQPDRYTYVDKSGESCSLDCLLKTPVLYQGIIYPEGLMGVWTNFAHDALRGASASSASVALVRQEDFLFQAGELARRLEFLGLDRRGSRRGDRSSEEEESSLLDPLLCLRGWGGGQCESDGLDMGQMHLLEALNGYAGLQEMDVGHAVSIDGATQGLRSVLGYTGYGNGRWGADGEAARWAMLAREQIGALAHGMRMSALGSICSAEAVTCSCESVLSGSTDLAALLRRWGVAWVRGAFDATRLRAAYEAFLGVLASPLAEELAYGNLRNNRRNTHLPFQPPFDGLELLGAGGVFAPALLELLGDAFHLESTTVITTPPETESQQTHTDIPCEGGITVHIPLHPITDGYGPLFVCGGTQSVTHMEAQQIAEQLGANYKYPSEEFEAAFRRRLCDRQHPSSELIVGAPIDVGDAILYDARIWHGGLANRREVARHALYIDYGMAHVSRTYSITNQEGGVDQVRKALLAFRHRLRELLAESPCAAPLRGG
uniref:Uncharacterized protein n=1 Tax=Alexandrium monilatum TaxID=311494 RepID=A0A7S4V194_9DINO